MWLRRIFVTECLSRLNRWGGGSITRETPSFPISDKGQSEQPATVFSWSGRSARWEVSPPMDECASRELGVTGSPPFCARKKTPCQSPARKADRGTRFGSVHHLLSRRGSAFAERSLPALGSGCYARLALGRGTAFSRAGEDDLVGIVGAATLRRVQRASPILAGRREDGGGRLFRGCWRVCLQAGGT